MFETVPTSPPKEQALSRHEPLIVEPSLIARNFWLLRRAIVAAAEDNCFSISKGAAYSFLLSLFPVLTTMAYLLVQARAHGEMRVLSTFIREVVPPGSEDLLISRLSDHSAKPISLSVVAIIVSLWAGSGAMMSLMEGFQAAYRIPSGRPFLKQRAMAIFLLFIAAIPAILASALIIFGFRGEAALLHWIPPDLDVAEISVSVRVVWRIGRYFISFGAITLVTGLLYYFGPNYRPEQKRRSGVTRSRFARVWPGAILATALWLLATVGFAWYVGHLGHYNIFYGSLQAVVVLLIWLYLIACIAMIGCEFNAERERIDELPSGL
ncbi:MAG: YihY/virulence factor BrkB family protein [Bryobacteraceae bacterium]